MNTMIDIEKNSADLKIDQGIYLKIVGKAIEQTDEDLGDFEEGLTAGDVDVVQRLSHRWKGDFDNLRITDLSGIAKQINDLVKETAKLEEIKGLYGSFKTAYEGLKNDLNGKI